MWSLKDILKYLDDKNISLEEKAMKQKELIIAKAFEQLSAEEIIYYLFESNLEENIKRLLRDEVDRVSLETSNTYSRKIQEVIDLFKSQNMLDEKYLDDDNCPIFLKKIIITEQYGNNVLALLSRKDLSLERKKNIVDLLLTKEQAIDALKEDFHHLVISYIIDKKINDPAIIDKCILDDDIPHSIKEKIISSKVNIDNIFEVIESLPYAEKKVIYDLKKEELDHFIESLTVENILTVINNSKYPSFFVTSIISKKTDMVEEAIIQASSQELKKMVSYKKDHLLVKLAIEKRKEDIYTLIDNLNPKEIFTWLSNQYIDEETKSYIIYKCQDKIEEKIKAHDLSSYEKYRYLLSTNSLPPEIFDKLFNEYKEELTQKFLAFTDEELLTTLMYCNYDRKVMDLLVTLRINKDNIFAVLSNHNLSATAVDSIFEVGNNTIISMFLDSHIDTILYETLLNLNVENTIKERIIETISKVLTKELTTQDKDTLLSHMGSEKIPVSIKKMIVKVLQINDTEVLNTLEVLPADKGKILVEHYGSIKKVIEDCNISFKTFLQYGSGSHKYSNWLEYLTAIIDAKKIEEFIQVKNYFFQNYYTAYQEKENGVYDIANFLELLTNFMKYSDLCTTLAKNNTILTKEDKLNLAFLFNLEKNNDTKVPTTKEELSAYKRRLYEKYIEDINDALLNEQELKEIFNTTIFCDAKKILDVIGGITGLKAMRKENIQSQSITALTNELILCSNMIEKINHSNNVEGLKEVLKYITSDIELLMTVQSIFFQFEKKIAMLYELDSKYHLTSLEKAKEINGVIDYQLMREYGGVVYNFSDKNYTLFAHGLSYNENVEDLLLGRSSGKSNFISVSPISYKGQMYYWSPCEEIFAFDHIPVGSFICSSTYDMYTNKVLRKNSLEVDHITREQRGILETSAVYNNNSETLLYREGLKACGIILPGGRKPTIHEMKYHQKYNLPFIITQNTMQPIDTPKMILPCNDEAIYQEDEDTIRLLKNLTSMIESNRIQDKQTKEYTGKEIAIFADPHSLYEPTLAVLEDIKKHGITEIYSLGDNIGTGPNPKEVFDLLEDYGVTSLAGNSEYYNTLGIKPFNYFSNNDILNQTWTVSKLGQDRIERIKLYKPSIDLVIGGKKLALCHFANDIRWDYHKNSASSYRYNFTPKVNSKQFLYTNSTKAKEDLERLLIQNEDREALKGCLSAKEEPLFDGKKVTDYDAIIQGHVHFHMTDRVENTRIYTLRATGMGYETDREDTACYYVLKEKKDGGFDIERRLVPFNKSNLLSNIYTSDLPDKSAILRYVSPKGLNR